MKYSQGGEEPVILEYFGDRMGRFLDCGAYDGRSMSNTLALAERGWGGVCVEPDPQSLEGLYLTHGENPSIVIAPVAISEQGGFMPFHNSRSAGVSTLSDSHRDKWAVATAFETIEVLTITPAALLEKHPGPYPFFNLDVEGHSADLFELFPLSDMGVELVCVEHDYQYDRVLAHCEAHGLNRELYRSGENLIVGKAVPC